MATNSLTRNSRGSDLAVNHLIDIFLSSIILQEGVISLWAQNMKPLRTVQVRRVPRAPLLYFPLILFKGHATFTVLCYELLPFGVNYFMLKNF